MFLNQSILENNDWIIYQINSSDYELLWFFAKFYQNIEKINKILKEELVEKIKSELIDFIKNNKNIPEEWKNEVLNVIDNWTIKLLEKQ